MHHHFVHFPVRSVIHIDAEHMRQFFFNQMLDLLDRLVIIHSKTSFQNQTAEKRYSPPRVLFLRKG